MARRKGGQQSQDLPSARVSGLVASGTAPRGLKRTPAPTSRNLTENPYQSNTIIGRQLRSNNCSKGNRTTVVMRSNLRKICHLESYRACAAPPSRHTFGRGLSPSIRGLLERTLLEQRNQTSGPCALPSKTAPGNLHDDRIRLRHLPQAQEGRSKLDPGTRRRKRRHTISPAGDKHPFNLGGRAGRSSPGGSFLFSALQRQVHELAFQLQAGFVNPSVHLTRTDI